MKLLKGRTKASSKAPKLAKTLLRYEKAKGEKNIFLNLDFLNTPLYQCISIIFGLVQNNLVRLFRLRLLRRACCHLRRGLRLTYNSIVVLGSRRPTSGLRG